MRNLRSTGACMVIALAISSPALAQRSTSGVARPDNGSGPSVAAVNSSLPPSLVACTGNCTRQLVACGTAAARLPGAARTQAMERCTNQRLQCGEACSASSPSPTTSNPPGMPSLDSSIGNDGGDPTAVANALASGDPDALVEQMVSAWQQREQARTAAATANLAQEMQQLLKLLCQSAIAADQGCLTGAFGLAAATVLMAALSGNSSATNRWSRSAAVSPPSTPAPASPASQPGGKGCYVVDEWPVVGQMWAQQYPMVYARFDGTGGTLIVSNSTTKDAWFGAPTPLDNMVPPGGTTTVPYTRYRSASDTRPSVYDFAVKYWTTDQSRCQDGGVQPGPTTLEEFGPPFSNLSWEYDNAPIGDVGFGLDATGSQ